MLDHCYLSGRVWEGYEWELKIQLALGCLLFSPCPKRVKTTSARMEFREEPRSSGGIS